MLAESQIDYLLKPTLAVLCPFNNLFRRQWDLYTAYMIQLVIYVFLEDLHFSSIITHSVILIWTVLQISLLYFSVRHGRRLAWNRKEWKDIDAFKTSERRWTTFFIISFGLLFLRTLVMVLIKDPASVEFTDCIDVIVYLCAIILGFVLAKRKARIAPALTGDYVATNSMQSP